MIHQRPHRFLIAYILVCKQSLLIPKMSRPDGTTKPEKNCQFTHLPCGVINERITRITPSCHLTPTDTLNRDVCRGQLELCHKQLAIS